MNYYFEERIVDTRQNELWTLKNFKSNNLVVANYLVANYLVAKNNEEWASMGKYGQVWYQYVRAIYNTNLA